MSSPEDQGIDLNARDEHQRSPLDLAALTNNFDCVRLLVDAGAEKNCEEGTEHFSTISVALAVRNHAMMRYLKELGFTIKPTGLKDDSIAYYALMNGSEESLNEFWQTSFFDAAQIKLAIRYYLTGLSRDFNPVGDTWYEDILPSGQVFNRAMAIAQQELDINFIFNVMRRINNGEIKEEIYHFAIEHSLEWEYFTFVNELLAARGIKGIDNYDRVHELALTDDKLTNFKTFLSKQSSQQVEEVLENSDATSSQGSNRFSHFAISSSDQQGTEKNKHQANNCLLNNEISYGL